MIAPQFYSVEFRSVEVIGVVLIVAVTVVVLIVVAEFFLDGMVITILRSLNLEVLAQFFFSLFLIFFLS